MHFIFSLHLIPGLHTQCAFYTQSALYTCSAHPVCILYSVCTLYLVCTPSLHFILSLHFIPVLHTQSAFYIQSALYTCSAHPVCILYSVCTLYLFCTPSVHFILSLHFIPILHTQCACYIQSALYTSNLNWKKHAESVVKKIRRSVGILSKIGYYVSTEILMNLYYALVYPFIMHGLIVWGNTYEATIKPVFVIQKRAVRVITFSNFDQHSSPLFKALKMVKFHDLVTYLIAIYMYKFHNQFASWCICIIFYQNRYCS